MICLAKAGFTVYGFDNSSKGIELTQQWLADENLEADLHLGDMTVGLPYEDNFFDAVVSIQVIHHARLETVESIIAEIARVLKTNGMILITVPTAVSERATHQEVAPNTFVPLNGIEKGLPHYIFDETQLRKSFSSQFDIQTLYVDHVAKFSLRAAQKS